MKYRTYMCEYWHDGSLWTVDVEATSFEDAQTRLRQMYHGKVLGTLEMRLPAVGGGNWLVDAICQLRNWVRKR